MKKIAVFCGSSIGFDKEISEQTKLLAQAFVENKIDLVYGGTNVGLMGILANTVLEGNGKAIGVIPDFIQEFKLSHNNLTELIVVKTMHERKAKMSELADGFIALPGGFGTMEELFEVLTMSQLDLHHKPVALLNINGFYDSLLEMLKKMEKLGFLQQINLDLLIVSDDYEDLLERMQNYKVSKSRKWEIT